MLVTSAFQIISLEIVLLSLVPTIKHKRFYKENFFNRKPAEPRSMILSWEWFLLFATDKSWGYRLATKSQWCLSHWCWTSTHREQIADDEVDTVCSSKMKQKMSRLYWCSPAVVYHILCHHHCWQSHATCDSWTHWKYLEAIGSQSSAELPEVSHSSRLHLINGPTISQICNKNYVINRSYMSTSRWRWSWCEY